MDPLLTGLDAAGLDEPAVFPSPFDEARPHPLACAAAKALQDELRRAAPTPSLLDGPGGGKMFGVLVVRDRDGATGFLRAFSGTLGGRFDVPGFAPPLFDRDARAAVEVDGERVVTALTRRAAAFAESVDLRDARRAVEELVAEQKADLDLLRAELASRRAARQQARAQLQALPPGSVEAEDALGALARESRRDKAERRRVEAELAAERAQVERRLAAVERRLAAHERLHRMVSRRLMKRIHDTYRVTNARGDVRALRELFAPTEPPGGAGDCAAPKLIAAATARGWRPLAMAEFWWGAPPPGGGRTAGEFYPACREKCAPLLPFLLDGVEVASPRRFAPPASRHLELRVAYEDEWIVVVDKPEGLLSVPGRGEAGADSVQARLAARFAGGVAPRLVHRLDLDTSGLLVAARTPSLHAALQKQFLARTVDKRYVAVVDGTVRGNAGTVDLALRADVHDRPRQVHDPVHGRRAVTHWEVLVREPRGRTRVAFRPVTGRTHQLRVHAAHPRGLNAAIVGDRLYGRAGDGRLMLHAAGLGFVHPATGRPLQLDSPAPF